MATARWLPRVLILLVVIALGFLLPTLFFDDAYITFRYAANLSHGGGFTYNPPEHVLGVTTPLLTLLLAAAARLGSDIESAALVLGVAGHALLCLAVLEAVPLLLPGKLGQGTAVRLLAALACALHPHLAFTAVGGMETPLYCALIVATLTAAARGRPVATGALLGAALMTRPDAVLLALPAAWLLWRDLEARAGSPVAAVWRATLMAAAVAGPWLIFATWYFGSPVPQSIAAKRLIHPYSAGRVLAEFGRFLRDDGFLIVALPLALWAIWRVRRPLVGAMAGFALLYIGAITLGGVEPFAWYINPPIPIVLMLGAVGLADLATRLEPAARRAGGGARADGTARSGRVTVWVIAGAMVLVVGVAAASLHRQAPSLRDDWDAWEGTYEIAGRWIMTDSKPGDSVYVGETGVIGYLLPGRRIIDSSGINSPEVYRRRLGRAEDDPEWSRQIVRDLRPDYITTAVAYLHIETLAREPWFDEQYEEVAAPLVKREGQVIYRRRRAP